MEKVVKRKLLLTLMQFVIFVLVFGVYYFSSVLGMGEYIPVIVIAGFSLTMVVFFAYRRLVIYEKTSSASEEKPWE